MSWFPIFILGLSVFSIVNGILHDVFVLARHKGAYDRNLLRLLMDGHILITCGLIYLISWFFVSANYTASLYLCLLASLSLLVYCIMIFPFLKSLVTILLNFAMLVLVVLQLISPQLLK